MVVNRLKHDSGKDELLGTFSQKADKDVPVMSCQAASVWQG